MEKHVDSCDGKLKPPCRCGGFHFVEPRMKITNCFPKHCWQPCRGTRCCCGCGCLCCDCHPCPCGGHPCPWESDDCPDLDWDPM